MPTIVWPATLPQYVSTQGYGEKAPNSKIRTQTDMGPAKVRRRFTSSVRPLNVTVRVTKAQYLILDAFYLSDTAEGTLPFEWVHPITQAAATMRFVGTIDYRPRSEDDIDASFQVEILP